MAESKPKVGEKGENPSLVTPEKEKELVPDPTDPEEGSIKKDNEGGVGVTSPSKKGVKTEEDEGRGYPIVPDGEVPVKPKRGDLNYLTRSDSDRSSEPMSGSDDPEDGLGKAQGVDGTKPK